MKTIPVYEPVFGGREEAYVLDALRSGWVSSQGAYLDRFEASFAAMVRVPHAVAVANGTVALHLALHALGVGPGDEVLVPDLTFAATCHAALLCGATPVLVDVEPETLGMCPQAAARAVTSRTRAALVVHLYGQPARVEALRAALPAGVLLVEDAAEALGARVGDQPVGSLGVAACFSFYGNKLITTGEGGMITCADDALARRLRRLRGHGAEPGRRYYHDELAFNYRLTNLQAALGLAQLQQVEVFLERKRAVAALYRRHLAGLPLRWLDEAPGTRSSFWMVSALLPPAASRDRVAAAMASRGVDTRPFFVPMSQLPHLGSFRAVGASSDGCPVAASASKSGINLPSSPGLSDDQVRQCSDALRQSLEAELQDQG